MIRMLYLLQSSSLLTDLLETGRDNHQTTHASLSALSHSTKNTLGGNADDGEIALLGHVLNGLVGLDSTHLRSRGVHGIHTSSERSDDEVHQNGLTDASLTLRSTNQSNVVGLEDGIQLVARLRSKQTLRVRASAIPSEIRRHNLLKQKKYKEVQSRPMHKSKLLFEDPSDSADSRYSRIRAFARTTSCFVRPIKTLYVCSVFISTHSIPFMQQTPQLSMFTEPSQYRRRRL